MDIPAILAAIRPGADWGMLGPADDYAALDWRDAQQTKPTLAELEAAWPDVEASLQPAAQEVAAAKRLLANPAMRRLLRAKAVVEAREIRALKAGNPRPSATLDELEAEMVAALESGATE